MSHPTQESAADLEPAPHRTRQELLSVHNPYPNDPPWSIGNAVSLWVASVLLIILMPALFLAPYAYSMSAVYPESTDLMTALKTDPFAIALQIFAIIPAHLITLAVAFLIVTAGNRYSFFRTLGWERGGMRWFHYFGILVGFFFLIGIVGYLLPEPDHEMMRILKSSRYAVFIMAALAVLTAPLVEEVVYRGVLYSAIQRTTGVGPAVAIVTLLFALVHLPQYYPSVATMAILTLLSLVLTMIRVRTNNLLPCVILHTIFNGMQAVLLIAEPYFGVEPALEDPIAALALFLS